MIEKAKMSRYILSTKTIVTCIRVDMYFKETRSVTMNIFRKKNLFKSFVKIELSYVFTINVFSTAKSCMEQ